MKVIVAVCRHSQGDSSKVMAGRILGKLGVSVSLDYDATGKPVLSDGNHASVSHSHGLFVMAIAPSCVGVDLEKVRDVNYAPVLARFGEDDGGLRAFYELWTRAESVFKAQGGTMDGYKHTELVSQTYESNEYVLTISSTNFDQGVEFLYLSEDLPKFEFLR